MGWKEKKVFGLAFFLHSFFLISKVGCITSRNKLQFPCISWTRNGNQSRYFLWLSRKHCESSKIHKLSDIFYDFIDFLPKSIQTLAQTQKKSQKTKSIHWIKKNHKKQNIFVHKSCYHTFAKQTPPTIYFSTSNLLIDPLKSSFHPTSLGGWQTEILKC